MRASKKIPKTLKTRLIKLGLFGASGKMGLALRQLIKSHFKNEIELYVEVSRTPTGDGINSYQTIDKVPHEQLQEIQVWIDFSRPQAMSHLLKQISKYKTPVVSGTTGLSKVEQKKLIQLSQNAAVFWASNMSPGLWAFRQALKSLTAVSDFDFSIEEIHHTKKIDNPSGTAVTLKEDLEKVIKKQITQVSGKRLGGVFGIHTVLAVSENEILKFEHTAMNRAVFAEGALRAALWLINQKNGLFNMDHFMNSKK